MNKKGVIGYYISFFIVAVLIVLLTAIFAPIGVMFNTEAYAAGEDILHLSEDRLSQINDTEVKAQVGDMLNASFDAAVNNIEVNNALFQYSWVFVTLLAAIMVYMAVRRDVEMQQGGFV